MQNFSIFKLKDSEEGKPTHAIKAKVGEEYTIIGKCWTKENQYGKYLSCALNKPYKKYKGYRIETEEPESDDLPI